MALQIEKLSTYYKYYRIPKIKDGIFKGYRYIQEPKEELKKLQEEMIPYFSRVELLPSVYGVTGKSSIENAKQHRDATIVINIDIQDFFSSTEHWLIEHVVREKFSSLFNMKDLYEKLEWCMLKEKLPTGAPTSPILSNIALSIADEKLSTYAKANNLVYTRYADDITISGEYRPRGLLAVVRSALPYNYRINWNKFRSMHYGYMRQTVTGVVVNSTMSVDRDRRMLLRSKLDHLARKQSPIDDSINGELTYVKSVNRDQYTALMRHYERRLRHYKEVGHHQSTEPGSSNP